MRMLANLLFHSPCALCITDATQVWHRLAPCDHAEHISILQHVLFLLSRISCSCKLHMPLGRFQGVRLLRCAGGHAHCVCQPRVREGHWLRGGRSASSFHMQIWRVHDDRTASTSLWQFSQQILLQA